MSTPKQQMGALYFFNRAIKFTDENKGWQCAEDVTYRKNPTHIGRRRKAVKKLREWANLIEDIDK